MQMKMKMSFIITTLNRQINSTNKIHEIWLKLGID